MSKERDAGVCWRLHRTELEPEGIGEQRRLEAEKQHEMAKAADAVRWKYFEGRSHTCTMGLAEVGTGGYRGYRMYLAARVVRTIRCQQTCFNRRRVCRFAGSAEFLPTRCEVNSVLPLVLSRYTFTLLYRVYWVICSLLLLYFTESQTFFLLYFTFTECPCSLLSQTLGKTQ